ncbi:regulatory particle triple-A ATPase 3 [Actinidia rufa]|uniref:Regulatory particle triple-A ATPase 3 n=1 Tax=Actinidia rufa TaxID=165716 RepID=A0A7J0E5A3_9ERIC|nr:regulatory particle triple-A ATPase 3 [Actinidia rufa]
MAAPAMFIDIQDKHVKDELKNLKRKLLRAQEEVKRIQSVPVVIGMFMEMVDQTTASSAPPSDPITTFSIINRELLEPSTSLALHRHSNALVDVLPPEADSSISLLSQSEKPNVTYNMDGVRSDSKCECYIMATNRADTLDLAILRPGKLDRKIEFPLLDRRQKRPVFQVCTAKMNLGDEVDLEDYVSHPDKISAAEVS